LPELTLQKPRAHLLRLRWLNPIHMPTAKPAKVPEIAASATRFSLVPATAQQQMHKALASLKPAKPGTASGAEVAEIAVCLAIGENDPVILACPASGARSVRKGSRLIGARRSVGTKRGRLTAATISAVAALLADSQATALVCAGKLDATDDYRTAFSFAARHKLPILFLVANALTPDRPQKIDLSTLHAEFGIPVFSVDATDAIAAYRVATEALHNARHLRGPCVIEALTVHGKGGGKLSAIELLRGYMERDGNRSL
jgi:Dehydrogenase E1 component